MAFPTGWLVAEELCICECLVVTMFCGNVQYMHSRCAVYCDLNCHRLLLMCSLLHCQVIHANLPWVLSAVLGASVNLGGNLWLVATQLGLCAAPTRVFGQLLVMYWSHSAGVVCLVEFIAFRVFGE